MSAKMAERMGAFSGYAKNAEPMLRVIGKHRKAAYQVSPDGVSHELFAGAARRPGTRRWPRASEFGYRNSQVTVLAPTGTIGFMMDCDTTGIEPDIALIKYKKLVGGGMLKIVNNTVPLALQRLGYSTTEAAGHRPATSTRRRPSRARRASRRSTSRCSTAPSSRPRASGASTTWATSG